MISSKKPLRFVTAASLFDGHDVSINIMRRILQSKGVEVIHLGHNRSASLVVDTALCEDADAIAISSYQGGHVEYFSYLRTLLNERGAQHIKIFGGGGGVITEKERLLLHELGITRIYAPEDGVALGLEGIIDDMIQKTISTQQFKLSPSQINSAWLANRFHLAQAMTYIENNSAVLPAEITEKLQNSAKGPKLFLGITGTGGAGKSSLIDELLLRFRYFLPNLKIALISIDPTRRKTQGALLGDRIRLTVDTECEKLFVRSMATRDSGNEVSQALPKILDLLKITDFELVIIETSGIGQSSDEITKYVDKSIYVMTPEFGAQTQLEKIEMLDVADMIVINKFEKPRAEDALRDVRKQFKRNRKLFETLDENLPIFGTIASQFNNSGIQQLFHHLLTTFNMTSLIHNQATNFVHSNNRIIPISRQHYLREIAQTCRNYQSETHRVSELLKEWSALETSTQVVLREKIATDFVEKIDRHLSHLKNKIGDAVISNIEEFKKIRQSLKNDEFTYQVRDKKVSVATKYISLSDQKISKVATPQFESMEQIYRFMRQENFPGYFPYTAGVFPFRRQDEDPKRQFAGEGGPARTNERFHLLCQGETSKRLSTAFDSVTLYGEDPGERLDVFGKIGESGVSIATLDDMKVLYQGFDLLSPTTSVSMTINGPAPIILAMFFNTAMMQKLSDDDLNNAEKCIEVMRQVRGTVQADILKEDQAQNTCIFSLDFALKLMGDVQEYFCKNSIKNYYSVSISGYHIAEAGANPITQLALTLSNGFTYVEYYLSRGMKIDQFAENLSFFFSNGLDPEYTVIGRVARKIWAIAMRDLYGANVKSQKLKYHIQTSGRSLHAQEIDFNDIRTTLQALLAIADNCNSLHTNAYDEAITTPTTESVRRAMAIQMIVNKEFGLCKTDNPFQGAYIIDELTSLVEEAVLHEFEKISDRGGVLGAMESMYQRSKIQDESMHYESLKDSGAHPIIGVNTFLNTSEELDKKNEHVNLTRASVEEKNKQIQRLKQFQEKNKHKSHDALENLKKVALNNENIFAELLETVRYCSLGQITKVLYEVGGRYRRNV